MGTNAFLQSFQAFTGSPSLSLPAPWPTGSLSVNQTAHPTVSGLSRSEGDLLAYTIHLQLPGQIDYTASLTKGWLGSATSYTLPDLSAPTLLGYSAPTSGSGLLSVFASMSNKSASDPADLSAFSAGDYIRQATAQTSYTVGGGPLTLP